MKLDDSKGEPISPAICELRSRFPNAIEANSWSSLDSAASVCSSRGREMK